MSKKRSCAVFYFFIIAFIFLAGISCKTSPPNIPIIELVKSGNTDELKVKFDKSSVNAKDEKGYTLLHIAAKQNSAEVVDFLCSMGANTEERDPEGKTPLLYALQQGSFKAAKVIASYNANIFAPDSTGENSFSYAGKNALFEYILNEKTVKQKDSNGRTPLHYAVMNFNRPLVQYILTLGKPSNEKDKKGRSLLSYVYKKPNHPDAALIAAALLNAGAEPLRKDFNEFETSVLKRNYSMRFFNGNSALHAAAEKGHYVFVKFLLNEGAPVDIKNESNTTPLHEAVRNGHVSSAMLLLENGANPNELDVSGNTPIHLVMPEKSRMKLFTELLKAGASPLLKDNYGETPLHIAARIGMDIEIIKMLINAGADVNERNKKGQSPLSLSVGRNEIKHAAIFVSFGADIHAADTNGESAYTKSLKLGLPMVRSIVNEKNIMTRDAKGKTPVHIAVEQGAGIDVFNYLLGKKADVNTRDMAGNTPLHIAAEKNNKDLGSILLVHNADIFFANDAGNSPLRIALSRRNGREVWMITPKTIASKDGRGNTPLHLAAEWGLASSTAYIMERGADVNALNINNETPLFCAVKSNTPASVNALLGKNARGRTDVTIRDFLGNSALHSAVLWSSFDAARALLDLERTFGNKTTDMRNLEGKTPLHIASETGNISFIKLFLSYKADVNSGDETGRSPLSYAVKENKKEAVIVLLKNGASPVQQDMYGQSPLHEAVTGGNYDCIQMVRRAGGNPMARDSYGKTPFTLSLSKGKKIMEAVLGRERFLADSDGRTPLHAAAIEDVPASTMGFVLRKGYPVNKRDKNGETALFCAVERNEFENARQLFAAGSDPFIANNAGESVVSSILKNKQNFLEMLVEFAEGKSDSLGDNFLHYAARFGNAETVRKLITLTKTDLSAKNRSGDTPYKIAMRWSRKEAAALLNPDRSAFRTNYKASENDDAEAPDSDLSNLMKEKKDIEKTEDKSEDSKKKNKGEDDEDEDEDEDA